MPFETWGDWSRKPIEDLFARLGLGGISPFDLLMAGAYVLIAGAIVYLLTHRRLTGPGRALAWITGFIAATGAAGHALAAFHAIPELQRAASAATHGAIVLACFALWPFVSRLVRQPSPQELQREVDSQLQTLHELRDVRDVLEKQVAARTAQLQETTQRFEAVLRQSPVSVFSQDKELRYTWVRNPPPAFREEAIGRTDEEILPMAPARQMTKVKRQVMECGEAVRTEIVLDADGEPRWYDLTVEPVRAVDGSIVGTTSAAVDVSYRKKNEELLELLLKEVTHRSKNLLAVIHAMVRHAGPRATTGEKFISGLTGRLRALAVTHDLLVESNWRGVPLAALVRAHLGLRADLIGKEISIGGPDIALGPNAADSIGLVVHELTQNAAEHGALSVPDGRVAVSWHCSGDKGNGSVVFRWEEAGGPPANAPSEPGFGRMLLEKAVGMSSSAEVKLEFLVEGVRCEIAIPAYHVVPLPSEQADINGAIASDA